MGILPEPDDVDFIVDGGDRDPRSLQETADVINSYKARPEYASEVRRAREILDSLGIDPKSYGMEDPQALLDHWRRCVQDLTRSSETEPARPLPGGQQAPAATTPADPERPATSENLTSRIDDLIARVEDGC